MRTVRTASGATAVQIVHGSRRGARDIEHLGSAHDAQAVEALKAVARQRLAGGQGEFDLGVDADAVLPRDERAGQAPVGHLGAQGQVVLLGDAPDDVACASNHDDVVGRGLRVVEPVPPVAESDAPYGVR